MLDVEPAVGLVQLKRYDGIIARRRQKAKEYNSTLPRDRQWIFPPVMAGATYSHYVVRVPSRDKVIKEYANQGIELGELIQYSIPDLRCYRDPKTVAEQSAVASRTTVNFPVS